MIKRINIIIVIALVLGLVQCAVTDKTRPIALLAFCIFPVAAMMLQWSTDYLFKSYNSEKRIASVESAMGRLDQTVHKELFALAREVAELKGRDEKNRTA